MGGYYDWVDRKWVLSGRHYRRGNISLRRVQRKTLLEGLLREIDKEKGSVTCMYASLLARAIVQADEELMRDFGRRVVQVTEKDIVTT
jgi:hypothetical protein